MVGRRRVTIKDVAAATGLSPAAVSYALRGIQTSAETQERVQAAATELGYTANAVARALSQGRTGLVGVLSRSLLDLGEQRFVEALGRGLGQHGLQMVVVDAYGEPDRERALARQLADQLVDGLVVSPLDPSDESWVDIGERLPVVTVGDALVGPTVGEVVFDNRKGVSLVLEHLHGLGHREVTVVTPSLPSTPDRPAEIGVIEVCEALGLYATIVNSPHSIAAATDTAEAMFERTTPRAVFCLSDALACGVYAAALGRGLSIPGDVSVIGYDNHAIGSALAPALSGVEWGMADVADAASDLLSAAILGEPRSGADAHLRVQPTLKLRASTAAP